MYAPLLVAGLASSLAGTGMQIAGNQKSQDALGAERAREVSQQSQFQREAQGRVNQSLSKSTMPEAQGQISGGAANRVTMYDALRKASIPDVGSASPATGNANSPSARASDQAGSSGNAWGNLVARAQANQGGVNDWENSQNIKNANAMSDLGVIGTKASNAASIYGTQQRVAMEGGQQLSGWGQLASSLGSLAMMGAAINAPTTAGSVGGSSAFTMPGGAQATTDYVNTGGMFYDPLLGEWSSLAK
jgi:hypothetical protein